MACPDIQNCTLEPIQRIMIGLHLVPAYGFFGLGFPTPAMTVATMAAVLVGTVPLTAHLIPALNYVFNCVGSKGRQTVSTLYLKSSSV